MILMFYVWSHCSNLHPCSSIVFKSGPLLFLGSPIPSPHCETVFPHTDFPALCFSPLIPFPICWLLLYPHDLAWPPQLNVAPVHLPISRYSHIPWSVLLKGSLSREKSFPLRHSVNVSCQHHYYQEAFPDPQSSQQVLVCSISYLPLAHGIHLFGNHTSH